MNNACMISNIGHPRDDNPHMEWKGGIKEWYSNSVFHREDGPAIVREDGKHQWYLKGYRYSFDKWCDKSNLSIEELVILKMLYG